MSNSSASDIADSGSMPSGRMMRVSTAAMTEMAGMAITEMPSGNMMSAERGTADIGAKQDTILSNVKIVVYIPAFQNS